MTDNPFADAYAPAPAVDERGEAREVAVAMEQPLTLYLDKRELLTLMTLGQMPEALAIGWLRNQRVVESLDEIEEVTVDWEVNAAAVYTRAGDGARGWSDEARTVTSGCGQGTMFGRVMAESERLTVARSGALSAAELFAALAIYRGLDTVYKAAGAVHGCALFGLAPARLLCAVEDIGRHNAVDAIAGWMWLRQVAGADKLFYTTGRLTSEMVIKCAQMGVPFLVSRSGTTRMGYEIANQVGVTMIGRAINTRYLIYSGADYFCSGAG